jgi:hypothetical protein
MLTKKNPDWIDWRNSAAREIILEDLEPGGALYGMDNVPVTEVFEFYSLLPEFQKVVLSQFTARLKDHQAQAGERSWETSRVGPASAMKLSMGD